MRPFTIINEEESSSCYLLYDGNVYYYLESVVRDNQTFHLWQHSECNTNIIETNGSLCDENKGSITKAFNHSPDAASHFKQRENNQSSKDSKKRDTQRNYENKKYLWKRIRIMVRNYKFHWFMALALNAVYLVVTMGIHGKVRDHRRQILAGQHHWIDSMNDWHQVGVYNAMSTSSRTETVRLWTDKWWFSGCTSFTFMSLTAEVDGTLSLLQPGCFWNYEETFRIDFSNEPVYRRDGGNKQLTVRVLDGDGNRRRLVIDTNVNFMGEYISTLADIIMQDLHIVKRLGSGKQATVWKVRDKETKIHYALKIFTDRSQFEREVKIMNAIKEVKVKHPDIRVPTMHRELQENKAYLMDCIDGVTLRNVGAFDDVEMNKVLDDLVETIKILAQHGIGSFDIKSDNIMQANKDGKWWIIDFGLGVCIDLDSSSRDYEWQMEKILEAAGHTDIMGTVHFAAPVTYWLNEHMQKYRDGKKPKKLDKQKMIEVLQYANIWSLQATVLVNSLFRKYNWRWPQEIKEIIDEIKGAMRTSRGLTHTVSKKKYKPIWDYLTKKSRSKDSYGGLKQLRDPYIDHW